MTVLYYLARGLVTAQQNGRQPGRGLCGAQRASLLLLIGIHGSGFETFKISVCEVYQP